MKTARLAGLALLLAAAACSQGGRDETASYEGAAPDVSPTAAPSVAFRYGYVFELADDAIAKVQETHAGRCEALGAAQCRITGLQYEVRDDDAIVASLTVKLAPGIARQFGGQAAKDVADANGKLRSTNFSGEDTEPVSTDATREQRDLETRIAALERQLATARSGEERAQLQAQLEELRGRLSAIGSTLAGVQQKLASTPMTFEYYGRAGIAGFRSNPIYEAGRSFVASVVTMVSVVLQLLAYALPWLLLLALLILIARSRPGRALFRFLTPRQQENVDG